MNIRIIELTHGGSKYRMGFEVTTPKNNKFHIYGSCNFKPNMSQEEIAKKVYASLKKNIEQEIEIYDSLATEETSIDLEISTFHPEPSMPTEVDIKIINNKYLPVVIDQYGAEMNLDADLILEGTDKVTLEENEIIQHDFSKAFAYELVAKYNSLEKRVTTTFEPSSKTFSELESENILLKAQNKANADRTDFHEEVLTEIILTIHS